MDDREMTTNENSEVAVRLSGVKKMYKLGQIGGGTLQGDLQSWWARKRGREDPNTKIGQEQRLVGQTFMALNGIDLTIYRGEALGIIGANGAGKSTMLKLLSRVTAPTEGEIDIYGRITSMLEVGTGFNGEMTGRENIYMNGAILGMTKAEIDAKMEDIIEFSEVREFIDTPVKRYSSGMYVKLAFSVAAHLDSEIMIMDEVLAVGDVAFQKKCIDKMKNVVDQEGRTVLYVSHNMDTIRRLCTRCIVLDKGKIIFEGNVEDSIERYLGSVDRPEVYYEYDKAEHYIFGSEKIRFTSLKILEKKYPVYSVGEIVHFELNWKSEVSLVGAKLRLEVWRQDGVKLGASLSDAITESIDRKQRVEGSFDTSVLVPGRYRIDITVFEYNEYGGEHPLEAVYPAMIIEIDETINEKNPLVWKSYVWGSVHLPDIKLTDARE